LNQLHYLCKAKSVYTVHQKATSGWTTRLNIHVFGKIAPMI
jgi:hypothetical protein